MPYILVIDDDDNFREMLSQMLQRSGYEVAEAENGAKGLKLCAEREPDLVLTDIIMPDMEGLETIRTLKQKYPHTKIIAMSGGGRIDANSYLPLAKGLGASRTLQKPFKRETLTNAIEEVLLLSEDI